MHLPYFVQTVTPIERHGLTESLRCVTTVHDVDRDIIFGR